MKLIINQSELSYALSTVSRAISGKPSMPVLGGVKIETTGESITCQATDTELSLTVTIPTMFPESMVMVVPGKSLTDLVKKLPDKPIEIETGDTKTTIKCQKSIYDLPVFQAAEYPELPKVEGEKIAVKLDDLKAAIKKVIITTLPDDPRPYACSLLFETSAGKIRLVGTDVNRLAIADINAETEQNLSVLVPVRAAKEILNLSGADAEIIIDNNNLQIEANGVTLTTRLLNAQYPNYQAVIPKNFSGGFEINRDYLIRALERVALVSSSIKFDIDETLTITAKEPGSGKANEQIEIDQAGERMTIGFNAKYLLDLLKVVDIDRVKLQYINSMKPVLVEIEGYKHIIMPLKVAE